MVHMSSENAMNILWSLYGHAVIVCSSKADFMLKVRSLVSEVRQKAFITKLEQTSLLREFACLTPST